jgi:transcriptional regulator NrdR family protein
MKKVHCPNCMSMNMTFVKTVCTDEGEVCGDRMECNHCGMKFVIAYDEAKLAGLRIDLPIVKYDESK